MSRRKHWRAVLCSLLLMLAAGTMVSCGSGQEETSLTVFVDSEILRRNIDLPLARFQTEHPGVELELIELPEWTEYPATRWEEESEAWLDVSAYCDAYRSSLEDTYSKVRSELIAGKGADVFVFSGNGLFPDLYKTAASGVFYDLEGELEKDADFHWEDFQSAVMEAGVIKGRRSVIPLTYQLPVLLTTEENLRDNGLSVSGEETLPHLLEAASAIGEDGPRIFSYPAFLTDFSYYLGADPMDYENARVRLDSPELQTLLEAYRPIYQNDMREEKTGYLIGQEDTVLSRKAVFGCTCDNWMNFTEFKRDIGERRFNTQAVWRDAALYREAGETPVLLPLRAEDGTITAQVSVACAVNNATKSPGLACDFIRALLRQDAQSEPGLLDDLPVRKLCNADRVSVVKNEERELVWQLPQQQYLKLGDDFYEQYLTLSGQIGQARFKSQTAGLLYEALQPYLDGKAEWSACVEQAEKKLDIYISE